MNPDRPSERSRRRLLEAMATAGVVGLGGCGDREDDPQETPDATAPPTETPGTATPTPSPNPEPTVVDPDDEAEATFDSPWSDADEPTGVPAYADDPDWRCVGHDAGNTGFNPHADGPDSDPTVRWSIDNFVDQTNEVQPLIVEDTVYFAASQELLAIDARTGEAETLLETDEGVIWRPTVVDDTLYVAIRGTIAAYDATDGTRRWRTNSPIKRPDAIRVVDGVVVVATGGAHIALDAETGERLWGRRTNPTTLITEYRYPIVADGVVLPNRGQTVLDVETGRALGSTPDIVYPVLYDGILHARSYVGGPLLRMEWDTFEPGGSVDRLPYGFYPGITDDVLVYGLREEAFVGLDPSTGEELWKLGFDALSWERGDLTRGEIVTDPDTAYIGKTGGGVIAVGLADGDLKWEFDPGTDRYPGNGIALADDLLVTADRDGNLFALE